MINEDIILTIGDMELKIPKDGNIQIRSKKGIVGLDAGFGVRNEKEEDVLTAPFTTSSTDWVAVTGLNLDELPLDEERKTILQYLQKIQEQNEENRQKLDSQNKLITKMMATISKMYQDGEMNKDTFNKLDDFLKPYYENPYQED